MVRVVMLSAAAGGVETSLGCPNAGVDPAPRSFQVGHLGTFRDIPLLLPRLRSGQAPSGAPPSPTSVRAPAATAEGARVSGWAGVTHNP